MGTGSPMGGRMKPHFVIAMVLGALTVTACADDPANLPERGEWETTTRVTRLALDGQVLPRDIYPAEITDLEKTERRCGEPIFTDRARQERDIDRQVDGDCTIINHQVGPSQIIGNGKCEGVSIGENFSPVFRMTIDQAPESFQVRLTMEGAADLSDAGRHMISATAILEGRRVGDCLF